MAFDQSTRNRLARFVSDARTLLTEEFTRQLQHEYGLDPTSGTVTPLEKLTALDDARWETASILRETMAYYLEGKIGTAQERKTVLDRILREQAFTVLNRICALRLAEARELILQAVGDGYQSQGFQLYARLAGPALGETGEAYRSYLFSLFDEMAVELPPLFDRFSPEGRLFPRQTALLALLDLLNDPELEDLWVEDETIGWIYQYFNTQEERKAMRAASQAPRNSRELAVRNQFFTPRYVVEFLTDNTLGRIWYEMTKGDTALVDTCTYLVRRPTEIFLDEDVKAPKQESSDEELSQEELLRQPVYIPHRQLKDPREIKMLDPACGSMHFGLYAFDLFEQIYAEAWDLEERLGTEALWRLADLEPLHETYPDKTAFLQDVPRLIIEYNIYGIDIDPRAVQIAGLSLWLRAHKSWGITRTRQANRPQIRKSNIVCAEPMPGNRDMLDDFLATLDEARLEALLRDAVFLPATRSLRVTKAMADALVDLVRKVWEEMELAGEAGSLLKIEETLRDAITEARKASVEQSPLFQVLDYGLGADNQAGLDFWDYAEKLVLAALQVYADEIANGFGYQKRLFVENAAIGFAFISLCQKHYDTVVMNPPFGMPSKKTLEKIRSLYETAKDNLYIAFVERASNLLGNDGLVGCITDRTFLVQIKYEEFRRKQLLGTSNNRITLLADLGGGGLDAWVQTAAYVVSGSGNNLSNATFINFPENNKEQSQKDTLQEIILSYRCLEKSSHLFLITLSELISLPGASMCFWLPKRIISHFKISPHLDPNFVDIRKGLSSGDNNRFYSLAWEIPRDCIGKENKWARLTNGGPFSPFFRDQFWVIYWEDNGKVVKQKAKDSYGSETRTIKNQSYYFRPGLTYGKRTENFSVQILPKEHIFTDEGHCLYFQDISDTWWLLSLLNSTAITQLLNSVAGLHKTGGYVGTIPIPIISPEIKKTLSKAGRDSYDNMREISLSIPETSLFIKPFLTEINQYEKIIEWFHKKEKFINSCLHLIDNLVSEIYQIEVIDYFGKDNNKVIHLPSVFFDISSFEDLRRLLVSDLVGYVFGCSLGRWDIRYATNEHTPPELPDPFDPLPACPPGMLQNAQGIPAKQDDLSSEYPLRISWLGILVDDSGNAEDVVERIRDALYVIWKEQAEAIEAETCEFLGVNSLREYFQNSNLFFDDHLKRYSKSRRYAPIYWPLSTPSGSYTLWLYYHRINDQILFTCVNDFVDPKLKQVCEDLVRVRGKSGRSRDEESELERLSDLERELKDFRAELLRVAAFWKPNLNDGVQITAAPLWRLFQHRNWQNRLRDTWEKLEAGDYDWAHLAYSIWPERVREKCKTDKSLAIAHDLESLYVEPPKKTKKSRRKKKSSQAEMDL